MAEQLKAGPMIIAKQYPNRAAVVPLASRGRSIHMYIFLLVFLFVFLFLHYQYNYYYYLEEVWYNCRHRDPQRVSQGGPVLLSMTPIRFKRRIRRIRCVSQTIGFTLQNRDVSL